MISLFDGFAWRYAFVTSLTRITIRSFDLLRCLSEVGIMERRMRKEHEAIVGAFPVTECRSVERFEALTSRAL